MLTNVVALVEETKQTTPAQGWLEGVEEHRVGWEGSVEGVGLGSVGATGQKVESSSRCAIRIVRH